MKFVIKTILAHFLLSIVVLLIFQMILKLTPGSTQYLSLPMIITIISVSTIGLAFVTLVSTKKRYEHITSNDDSKAALPDTTIVYLPPTQINPFKFQENLKKYFNVTIADHENLTYKFHENFDYFQLSSRYGYYLKPHAYTDQFYLEIIPYSPRLFSEKKLKKRKELIENIIKSSC